MTRLVPYCAATRSGTLAAVFVMTESAGTPASAGRSDAEIVSLTRISAFALLSPVARWIKGATRTEMSDGPLVGKAPCLFMTPGRFSVMTRNWVMRSVNPATICGVSSVELLSTTMISSSCSNSVIKDSSNQPIESASLYAGMTSDKVGDVMTQKYPRSRQHR